MFKFTFAFILFFYLPLSFANPYKIRDNFYKRGNIKCKDFEEAEKRYKGAQKEGSKYNVSGYAHCLLARGMDDARALSLLEKDVSTNRSVPSADLLAIYTATGGKMDMMKLDSNNYDEAFRAFQKVIELIKEQGDNYRERFPMTATGEQHELDAYYRLVLISYAKALKGMYGLHNIYLFQSPTYNKDKNLLEFYPEYNPYIEESLRQTIENADTCIALDMKSHFDFLRYQRTRAYCIMVRRVAKQFLSIEEERFALLNDDSSCAEDIVECAEYQVLFKSQELLFKEGNVESKRIWNSTTEELLLAMK